jgi:hypothetical protein
LYPFQDHIQLPAEHLKVGAEKVEIQEVLMVADSYFPLGKWELKVYGIIAGRKNEHFSNK